MSPPAFEIGNLLAPFTGRARILRFVVPLSLAFLVAPAYAQDTSRLGFVSEYIRELGVNEHTRVLGERALAASLDDNQLTGMIQNSTRIQSDLRAEIQLLKGIHLKLPFDTLPSKLAQLYTNKAELHQRLIDIATGLQAEPKVSVSYASSSADIAKITASLENLDRSLFETTPLIFATLVARAPDDKNGRVGRLNITKAERQVLLRSIAIGFGRTMEQNNRDFILRSAFLLRDLLLKYKSPDERN